jgi:SAM-dependent methyltransferase
MANTLYRSPGDYDDIYHDFTADLYFWRWAAETYSKGLQVGEFACGTGRVTIELAKSGFGVYGVDLSLPMLEMARGKLLTGGLLDKVKLSAGNMIDFRTGIFHNLIIVPFTSFAHLIGTEKQLAALRNLRDQLTADGMLIIDVFNPSIAHLSGGVGVFTQPIYEKRTDLPSGDVLVRYRTTRYHQSTQLYEWVFYIEVYDGESTELKRKYTQEATVQVTFPNEWRLLIQSAGLKLVECYGDYGRGMFSDNAPRMILVMERA